METQKLQPRKTHQEERMVEEKSRKMHIAMFPWFAYGHMIPYLHLANELAERGHKITFFLPRKAHSKLQLLNSHPHLITFHPLIVSHVHGLPPGTETVSDISRSLIHLLAIALDRTRDQIEAGLRNLSPDTLLFDFAYWAPALAAQLGIESVHYSAVCAAALAYSPVRYQDQIQPKHMPTHPSGTLLLRRHEAQLREYLYEQHVPAAPHHRHGKL